MKKIKNFVSQIFSIPPTPTNFAPDPGPLSPYTPPKQTPMLCHLSFTASAPLQSAALPGLAPPAGIPCVSWERYAGHLAVTSACSWSLSDGLLSCWESACPSLLVRELTL